SDVLCLCFYLCLFFFFSSRRRHTRFSRDWSSDVCSSDLEALLEFLSNLVVVVDKRNKKLSEFAAAFEGESAERLVALDKFMGCCPTEYDIGQYVIQGKVEHRVEAIINGGVAHHNGCLRADVTVIHFVRPYELAKQKEVLLAQLPRVFTNLRTKVADVFFRHVFDGIEAEAVDVCFADPVAMNQRHELLDVECLGRLIVAEGLHAMEVAFTRFRVAVEVSYLSLAPVQVGISQLAGLWFVVVAPIAEGKNRTIVIIVVIALGVAPHVSCVMQDDVEDYPHVAFMSFIYQFGEILFGAEPRVNPCEVYDVVAVVRFRVVFEYRTQPERGTPEVFDVVEVFRDALYGATTGAVELFGIAKALLFPPSRSRHAIVVIVEPVDHKEVNKFLAPVSGAIGPVLFPGLGG